MSDEPLTICKIVKPLNEIEFCKNTSLKHGYGYMCHVYQKELNKEVYCEPCDRYITKCI